MIVRLYLAQNHEPFVLVALGNVNASTPDAVFAAEGEQLWNVLLRLPSGTLDHAVRNWLRVEAVMAERRIRSDKADEHVRRFNRMRLAHKAASGDLGPDPEAAEHAEALTALIDGQDDELAATLREVAQHLLRV